MTEIDKDPIFPLGIERTGVIKHITLGMVLSWNDAGDKPDETVPLPEFKEDLENAERANNLVLQDGIVEWMVENLEKPVYFSFSFEKKTGPTLLFESEADRASFILKWL